MTERIDLSKLINNPANLTSHLLLEFANTKLLEELTGHPDFDLTDCAFQISINGIPVSTPSFEDFLQFVAKQIDTTYCEPEDKRIQAKAEELLKSKVGDLMEKMCDIEHNLDWCLDRILPPEKEG